jgi:uncharacterized membrane protein
MSTALIISYTILIIALNLFSAKMLSEWLNPKENLFDVWVPRISLFPPLGIIGLLLALLVMFITVAWWAIRDIWE